MAATVMGEMLGVLTPANTGNASTTVANINAAINEQNAAGGGEVFLPAGTWLIQGTGTASAGAIVMKDGVTLRGAGMGATILKLKDTMGSGVTGLVRTPSGVSNSNVTVRDLTIDGNKANNASGAGLVIGFYCGVTPTLAATAAITRSGTTATLTASSGSIAQITVGQTIYVYNVDQTDYVGDFTVLDKPTSTTLTYTVANSPTTPSTSPNGGFALFYPGAIATMKDYNITLERVEIKNCNDYGFDPHERTKRLLLRQCISHDNDLDGFTLDFQEDCEAIGCVSYSNGRHGFNITTSTNYTSLVDCHAYSNGQASAANGVTIQRGSDNIPFPNKISIVGGKFHENLKNGILVQMGKEITITGAECLLNQWSGINLTGCTYSTIVGNLVKDNSQLGNASKAEINVAEYDDSAGASASHYGSTDNVVTNNNIQSTVSGVKASYSILEASDGYEARNDYRRNMVAGAATGDYFLGGSTSPYDPDPVLIRPQLLSGRVMGPSTFTTISTSTLSANIATFTPITVGRLTTFTSFVFSPTLATNVSYKVGVYASKDGKPTGLPITGSTGTVSAVTVASVTQQTMTFSSPIILNPGIYFLSVLSDTSSTVNAVSTNGGGTTLGYLDTTVSSGPRYTKSQTYANGLPDMTGVTPTVTDASTSFFYGLTVQ